MPVFNEVKELFKS